MHYLRFYAGSGVPIRTPDEFGVPSQAKEAIAFALLAAATLEGVPSNVPSVTGAKRAVVLGSITPRP
jgi:anhydro-N-acetylmuramic acid kinase